MKIASKLAIVTLALLFGPAAQAQSQQDQPPPPTPDAANQDRSAGKPSDAAQPRKPEDLPEDYAQLSQMNELLSYELTAVRRHTQDLMTKLRSTVETENDIARYESELAVTRQSNDPDKQARIAMLEKTISDLKERAVRSGDADELEKDIDKNLFELGWVTERLMQVQAKMNKVNETKYVEQSFKYSISWIFAGLVGVIILAFFFIAYRDPTVGQAIFKGYAGMQFITLFSLVIAIILFGITGILEGKELAALLGGISGYILGRASGEAGTRPATPETPKAETPAAPAGQKDQAAAVEGRPAETSEGAAGADNQEKAP